MTIHDEAWPDTLKDQAAIDLLKTYMQLSNASNPAHPDDADEESFASLFTADGIYELGSKRAQGQTGRRPHSLLEEHLKQLDLIMLSLPKEVSRLKLLSRDYCHAESAICTHPSPRSSYRPDIHGRKQRI